MDDLKRQRIARKRIQWQAETGDSFELVQLSMRDIIELSEIPESDTYAQAVLVVTRGCPEIAAEDIDDISPAVLREISSAIQTLSGLDQGEAVEKSKPTLAEQSGIG